MPSGWLVDQQAMIQDPDTVRPEDWDDEMDGKSTNTPDQTYMYSNLLF